MDAKLSIILPACNEAESLARLLPELTQEYPDAEIIVINDGSNDRTTEVCNGFNIRLIEHPYNKGNGAAIKTGVRAATGEILVLMDADGQHLPEDIPLLLENIERGYDMAVGARHRSTQASMGRLFANGFYNKLASLISGNDILDLTSGFRAVRAEYFEQFLYLLPNGFSYPTTITMAFYRSGYSIVYVPIRVNQREGKSHMRPLRDGLRFLLIIFKIGMLYSPLKIFAPSSLLFFLMGMSYYGYTYITMGRFTNMSALLFIVAILVFLIGLVSEQITMLLYQKQDK